MDAVDDIWRVEKQRFIEAARQRPDLTTELRRLVAYSHYDWVLPLRSALQRAFDGRTGRTVLQALERRKLVATRFSKSGDDSFPSAATIIDGAMDGGRLLELAAMLEGLASSSSTPMSSVAGGGEKAGLGVRGYPRHVAALAGDLLRWHAAVLDMAGLSEQNDGRGKR